jgi:hypothetical protein
MRLSSTCDQHSAHAMLSLLPRVWAVVMAIMLVLMLLVRHGTHAFQSRGSISRTDTSIATLSSSAA